MNLLEFQGIEKRFGQREVLSSVSFNILKGEIFGLIGSSGCGKSTLFNILLGMMRADNGKIMFEGENALQKLESIRENTGFATQHNMLFDELTIEENSFYFGALYNLNKKEIRERMHKLLKLLSLGSFEQTQVQNLSGGMEKRANLLVSLIHNPKLLVLDEPTGGLDPVLRKSLWRYINQINKTGTTILVTSHLFDEIGENCDRIGVLKGGTIVSIGTLEQYKKHFGKEKTLDEIFGQILGNENI